MLESIKTQERYRHIALTSGTGILKRTKYGGFVVFSRMPPTTLLEKIKEVEPTIESLEQLKTLFLLGPTPTFFGDGVRATTSWRREFLELADQVAEFDARFLVVIPEPEDCNWKSVDYSGLESWEHVYAQLHWEDYFINLAAETGILVLHAHFRWAGNAGPTARLEAGKLFALMKEGKVNACVLNMPNESETVQYITAHLVDAKDLHERGFFTMTTCSPLIIVDNEPVDNGGCVMKVGTYPNGASEPGHLYPFFIAIMNIATLL